MFLVQLSCFSCPGAHFRHFSNFFVPIVHLNQVQRITNQHRCTFKQCWANIEGRFAQPFYGICLVVKTQIYLVTWPYGRAWMKNTFRKLELSLSGVIVKIMIMARLSMARKQCNPWCIHVSTGLASCALWEQGWKFLDTDRSRSRIIGRWWWKWLWKWLCWSRWEAWWWYWYRCCCQCCSCYCYNRWVQWHACIEGICYSIWS